VALSAIDYFEIQQLYSRYCFAIDLGDIEGFAACFTEDGAFQVLGLPAGAPAAGRTIGHDALKVMDRNLYEGLQGHSRHWVSPTAMVIEGDEHEVKAKAYLTVFRVGSAPAAGVILTAIYWDTIRNVDGHWLFSERLVQSDPQPGAAPSTDVLVVAFDEAYPPA
jgi:SnoaL-like domain